MSLIQINGKTRRAPLDDAMSQDESPKLNDAVLNAYKPDAIAARIEDAGVAKAGLPLVPLVTLSILAGVFIAFGAMFFTLVTTDSGLGFGPNRLLGGVAFSLGLILVVVAGAELFTGNNLIVMAWADGKIGFPALLRNWVIVYAGNLIGALLAAIAVYLSGTLEMAGGAVGANALAIAKAKISLSPGEAFVRAVLCNALVCLAVWLSYAARRVSGKILAIIFPISAFVALGLEHSIANMYFLPLGNLLDSAVTMGAIARNLFYVTVGNIVGGSVCVALVYWVAYRMHRGDGG